jgi:hypothetical protein
MDRNPRKSKAVIIAIIVVLILVLAGYFLLRKTTTTDPVTGETTSSNNKVFSSLFGTSKKKTLTPVEKSEKDGISNVPENTTPSGTGTNTSIDAGIGSSGSFGTNSGFGVNSGFGSTGSFAPTLKPLPTPGGGSFSSNFGTTSGLNGLTFGNGSGSGSTPNTLTGSNPQTGSPDICPIDDPLTYTDDEKAQLEELLRQYYLLASNIKTNDDIALINNDLSGYRSLIDQSNSLTNQCVSEKSNSSYTGPQIVKDNPYYSGGSSNQTYLPSQTSAWIQGNPGTTISDYGDFENIFDIW